MTKPNEISDETYISMNNLAALRYIQIMISDIQPNESHIIDPVELRKIEKQIHAWIRLHHKYFTQND